MTFNDPVSLDFFEDSHDKAFLRLARNGDLSALEHLIRKHQRMLYSVAVATLGDAGEAQQATCVTLVRACGRLLPSPWDHGFLGCAYRLLICECVDSRKNGGSPSDAPLARDGAVVSVPARRPTCDARRDHLRAELRQLAPEDRAIVVLRHIAALSYRETGLTLALTTAAVRSRLYSTRQWLGQRVLPLRRRPGLSDEEEALLQGDIDGELDPIERKAHDRLVAEQSDARAVVAVNRELSHLLNSLGPVEPPCDLAPLVLSHVADLTANLLLGESSRHQSLAPAGRASD